MFGELHIGCPVLIGASHAHTLNFSMCVKKFEDLTKVERGFMKRGQRPGWLNVSFTSIVLVGVYLICLAMVTPCYEKQLEKTKKTKHYAPVVAEMKPDGFTKLV